MSFRRVSRAIAVAVAAVIGLGGCEALDPGTLAPSRSGPADGDLVGYSFGHPAVVVPHLSVTDVDALQRVPFALAVEPTSFRVHLRNWNYLTDEPVPGTLDITGLWIGEQAGDDGTSSAFATEPAYIAEGGSITDGESYASPWISAEDVALKAGTRYLLSMGLVAEAGVELAATGSVSWLNLNYGSGIAGSGHDVGDFNSTSSLLDVWIESTVDPATPTAFVLGHSLSAAGNAAPETSPHGGESTTWPQLWAKQVSGAATNFSVPGAWTVHFAPDSSKWTTYGDAEPDFVALWTASSDIASGRPIDEVRSTFQAVLQRARSLWPEARVFAFTEPPRGNADDVDAVRRDWNRWLLQGEPGLDGVVDAATALTDPESPLELHSDFSADGSHLNTDGHALVARLFGEATDE